MLLLHVRKNSAFKSLKVKIKKIKLIKSNILFSLLINEIFRCYGKMRIVSVLALSNVPIPMTMECLK